MIVRFTQIAIVPDTRIANPQIVALDDQGRIWIAPLNPVFQTEDTDWTLIASPDDKVP